MGRTQVEWWEVQPHVGEGQCDALLLPTGSRAYRCADAGLAGGGGSARRYRWGVAEQSRSGARQQGGRRSSALSVVEVSGVQIQPPYGSYLTVQLLAAAFCLAFGQEEER
jgi:hypothetical protein